jgi:histidine ammonia-lyase
MPVTVSGSGLSIEELVQVAREGTNVEIADDALAQVERARGDLEDRIKSGETMYGINTGFGAFQDQIIEDDEIEDLQENLIRSHTFGVGAYAGEDQVRAMMLLRLNSLLSGRSGVRSEVVKMLRDMLNAGVHPQVPKKGSASASGDLAPLSHMALVMMGEGEAKVNGEVHPAEAALEYLESEEYDPPLSLAAKEGLALVNGTNYITGIGALAVHDAEVLFDTANVVGTLTLEGMAGIEDAFYKEIHELRNQEGQKKSAERIRNLIEGSELVTSSDESEDQQDEYSLRCMPQVHGATKDVIEYVRDIIERELNAVTDNPLILENVENGSVVSGGNFHGQPVALALDSLSVAVAELANISERRLFTLVAGEDDQSASEYLKSELEAVDTGEKEPQEALESMRQRLEDVDEADETTDHDQLPMFLVGGKPGLNSGFMIPQVTAAALVSENKTLVHPASSDSVPTSDNQEDHVSMGANAANHLVEIIENVKTVLGIEAFAAYQALSLRDRSAGEEAEEFYSLLDDHVDPLGRDRVMLGDLEVICELIEGGELR